MLMFTKTQARLAERTWLIGGMGSLSSTASTVTAYTGDYNQKASTADLKFSPAVGYFFTGKFAAGIKPAFSHYKTKIARGGVSSNDNRFDIGPFIRYYFLHAEKNAYSAR